uniref:ribbon-helix-helix domain-containing protein n=1 Tax=Enterocloster clostridioformis TaxID=1531 RepID=UPI002675F533|nr:ribbon-helix-helix domain-containing protein [Enterocloster clostridioformis]
MSRPKKDGEKYVRQNISMDPQQLERLTTYCQKTDRPISWVIRQALDKYLDDNVA